MSSPHFRIEHAGNCLLCTLRGTWSLATDIQYLATLAEETKSKKGQAYILIADIRSWQPPEAELIEKVVSPLQFDSRNQQGEFWLEDEHTRADYIAQNLKPMKNASLIRSRSPSDLLTFVSENCVKETYQGVAKWLQNNNYLMNSESNDIFA